MHIINIFRWIYAFYVLIWGIFIVIRVIVTVRCAARISLDSPSLDQLVKVSES